MVLDKQWTNLVWILNFIFLYRTAGSIHVFNIARVAFLIDQGLTWRQDWAYSGTSTPLGRGGTAYWLCASCPKLDGLRATSKEIQWSFMSTKSGPTTILRKLTIITPYQSVGQRRWVLVEGISRTQTLHVASTNGIVSFLTRWHPGGVVQYGLWFLVFCRCTIKL